MDPDLQQAQKLDQNTQYLVSGYVRQFELFHCKDEKGLLWNVSDLIVYTIMAFHFHIEYFEHYAKNTFFVAKHGKIVTRFNTHYGEGTVYGSKIIPYNSTGVHHWKLKIGSARYIVIGIDEANHKWMRDSFHKANGYGAGALSYGYSQCSGNKWCPEHLSGSKYMDSYNDGDIIEMELDMNKKIISFCKNNDKLMTRMAYIEKTLVGYCLAISMQYEGNSVRLLSYKCKDD